MLTGPDAIGVAGAKPLPIYLEGRSIPMADALGRALGLKFNEVVRGVVEARGETLLLKLNGREVELPAQLKFRPGEVLWLRYTEMGRGMALVTQPGPGAVAAVRRAGRVGGRGSRSSSPNCGPTCGRARPRWQACFFGQRISRGCSPALRGTFAGLAQRAQGSGSAGVANGWAVGLAAPCHGAHGRGRSTGPCEPVAFSRNRPRARAWWFQDLKLAMRQAILFSPRHSPAASWSLACMSLRALRQTRFGVSKIARWALAFIPFRDAISVMFFLTSAHPEEPNPPAVVNLYTRSETLGEV